MNKIEEIRNRIHTIREKQVRLDFDVSELDIVRHLLLRYKSISDENK